MPAHSNNSNQAQLPDSLRSQLQQFRSQLWRIKIMEAIWAGFFGLIFSFILVFFLDRFIPTSGFIRLCILASGVSVFAIFAPLWINRWVFKHRRENQIAQLIAKQYPRLGDRLLGVVELQNQDTSSPRLKEAAMAQVAEEFSNRDLNEALPITWHKKWGLAVLALVIITIGSFSFSPKASINSLQRWIMPLAEIERYTETKVDLSTLPSPYYVAQGETYSIDFELTEESNSPASAKARQHKEGWKKAPAEEKSFSFDFPKIFKPQEVEIKVGDAHHSVEVQPIVRPTLSEISAQLTYPEYLQKEAEVLDLSSGQLSIVEGASISITGRAKLRDLSSVRASILIDDTEHAPLSASIHGSHFSLSPVSIENPYITIPLNWTDEHGLRNATPTKLGIEKQLDQAPSVYLENTQETYYLLQSESIAFDVFAEDDFGIKRTGFSWIGSFTKPSPHTAAKGSLDVAQGNPQMRQVTESLDFSFEAYDIRPQKLIIQAWAEDYKADRPRVYSSPVTVFVLTKAEHRERIEQRTKSATNKLEELMRTELQLLDENMRLERLDGKQLQTPEKREELAEQSRKEKANAESMEELAEKMQDLFKDASKNDKIDTEALKKLAESALQMKQMATQKMPDISKKLDSAQSRENTEQKAKEEVQEAVKKQQELLEEMEKAISNTTEISKQLEAGTFVNRLNKAAENEELLALGLVKMMLNLTESDQNRSFIINEFTQLDPQEQRSMLELYAQQKQTGDDLHWIEEDLAHFYLRTKQEEHKAVLDKVRASTIHKDMEDMLFQLEQSENNLTAVRANKAAKQLKQWSKELADAIQKSKSQAGAGGGAQTGASAEDFEFMLRVLRLIQQETSIRGRIRSLEQKRRFLDQSKHPVVPIPLPLP